MLVFLVTVIRHGFGAGRPADPAARPRPPGGPSPPLTARPGPPCRARTAALHRRGPRSRAGAPMRLTRYFLPVLSENPAEAQIVSHRLMLRAGMIKQQAAGIYSWLPLGFKVLQQRRAASSTRSSSARATSRS